MNPQQPDPQQPDPQQPAPQNPEQPQAPPVPPPTQPQVVFMSRPMEPQKVHVSQEALRKHEESKKKYPRLNLSEGEYIILAIDRHPIGLIQIWAAVGIVIFTLVIILALLMNGTFSEVLAGDDTFSPLVMALPLLLLAMLAMIFGFISTFIYNANKFFLTNESVIQQIQTSLFSKREQTVSLSNVEDASFTQDGVLPHMLNYGMIRLSTEGDETTYRFNYASSPAKQIAVLNNAVEAFKNGRPVD
jgi:hypothetical protein